MDCALRYILTLCLVIIAGRILPGLYEFVVSLVTLGTTLYIAKHATFLLCYWIPTVKLHPGNKAVFITGCDTGFGHESAKRLDKLGFRVFAGCLQPTGEGAEKLRKMCSSNLQIVPLDVTKDESVSSALETVKNGLDNKDLWAVINIAGIGTTGEGEICPLDDFKSVIEVNSIGVVRVSQAFLPLLRKSKGRLITITSIAGRLAFPGCVAYCMSKYAAVSFCEGLRLEMKKWGVKVISIEPWTYRTNILLKTNIEGKLDEIWEKTPDDVKEDYGKRYLEDVKRKSFALIEAANPNISEVVDCVENALLEEVPSRYYRPSSPCFKVFFWATQFLPQCAIDFMIMRRYTSETPAMFLK